MTSKIPAHIGFIMDGNGRWAKSRMLPRKMGHRQGVKALKRVLEACRKAGVHYVTFYAFSTENWARPQEEIAELFDLVKRFADEEMSRYADENVRLRVIGDLSVMPAQTRAALEKMERTSAKNDGMTVNLAINYGGRQELTRAVNRLLASGVREIDEAGIAAKLYTAGQPDPDVIVRSAGEKRLSNFLLWQCAYSELIFVDQYWPDFDEGVIKKILEEYGARERRFGKVKQEGKNA